MSIWKLMLSCIVFIPWSQNEQYWYGWLILSRMMCCVSLRFMGADQRMIVYHSPTQSSLWSIYPLSIGGPQPREYGMAFIGVHGERGWRMRRWQLLGETLIGWLGNEDIFTRYSGYSAMRHIGEPEGPMGDLGDFGVVDIGGRAHQTVGVTYSFQSLDASFRYSHYASGVK